MAGSRAVRLAIALIGYAAALGSALAETPALVVDVATGKVLHAERATDPWYPASITKLMTTYVALDMVRRGEASFDQLLTLSPEAAAQPPSKMGLKPGTQIRLDNALKIIMVKSANDIAMMIGENLGGSVEGFAARMNETAHRLGLHESVWVNPNGLYDERQHTSARDMAIVATALLRDFPEQEGLFHIGAIQLGRQIIRNHNGMLGRYPGADGMKTGFICAGGFNIVATATQNGRKLMAVVFGYPSARERDLRAADLLDEGFASSSFSWGQQRLDDLPPSSLMSPPDLRNIVCGPHRRPQDDDESAVVAKAPIGNTSGGLATLFSSSTLAFPNENNVAKLGSRRDLGPRVAFQPIRVWLGATPDTTPDKVKAAPVQVAAKPVRTKPLSRNAAGGQLPSTAQAFTSASTGAAVEPKPVIDVVKTSLRPGGRAALRAHLAPRPTAEVKAKSKRGQIGAGGSRAGGHGAIALKQPASIMAVGSGAAEAPKATARKPAKAASARPVHKPAKAKPQASAAETE